MACLLTYVAAQAACPRTPGRVSASNSYASPIFQGIRFGKEMVAC